MIKEIDDFRMLGKNPSEEGLLIVIDMAHSCLYSLEKEEAETKGEKIKENFIALCNKIIELNKEILDNLSSLENEEKRQKI